MQVAPGTFAILNATEDSFSDGGKYLTAEAAIARARALLADGADVLDIGAAASNPDAIAVSPAEEIRRLAPIIAAVPRNRVSVDTFASETQAWALTQGVAWLNDIQGFPEPTLYKDIARSDVRLVVMHNVAPRGQAQRIDTDPATIFDRLYAFFDDRLAALERAGIARVRMVVDPGMGFFLGTNPEVSLTVLRRLRELKARYRLPLLVSVSRKSFVRRLANVSVAEAGSATLAAELYAAAQGADWVRTHDVAALKRALAVWSALHERPRKP